jgi:hypothetical protein
MVPKYRFRILTGALRDSVASGIQAICAFVGCDVVELNVRPNHVYLVNDGTAEGCHIGFVGASEGPDIDATVASISAFGEKALLGRSSSGQVKKERRLEQMQLIDWGT